LESIDVIAANIEEHARLTSGLELICKYYKIKYDASPLYNFRDALSHFILRYEAKTDEEKIAQESSINEHIFRGTKDIFVTILYEMKQRVIEALNSTDRSEQQQEIRQLLHRYKKIELEIRGNSETTVNRTLVTFVESLNNLIQETKRVFELYGIKFVPSKKYQ